jgi:hypothetical protein
MRCRYNSSKIYIKSKFLDSKFLAKRVWKQGLRRTMIWGELIFKNTKKYFLLKKIW